MSIGTDAHARDHLRFMDIGAGTARRGWARKRDVINTRSAKELKRLFGEG
jgi:DNA polymerase (family 10)